MKVWGVDVGARSHGASTVVAVLAPAFDACWFAGLCGDSRARWALGRVGVFPGEMMLFLS